MVELSNKLKSAREKIRRARALRNRTTGQQVSDAAKQFLEGAGEGLAEVAALPLEGSAFLARQLGLTDQQYGEATESLKNLGVDIVDDPVTTTDRAARAAGRGVGIAAPTLATGGAMAVSQLPRIAQAGRALSAQPVLQTGTSVAAEEVSEATGSPLAGLATAVALPAAVTALRETGRRIANPGLFVQEPTAREAEAIQLADEMNIPLTPAQRQGDDSALLIESSAAQSKLGRRTRQDLDNQRAAINRAALKEAGIDASEVSEEVLIEKRKELQNVFNKTFGDRSYQISPDLQQSYSTIRNDIKEGLLTDEAKEVEKQLKFVEGNLPGLMKTPGKPVSGKQLQRLNTYLDNVISTNSLKKPEITAALQRLQSEVVFRIARENLDGPAREALRAAEYQYLNLSTIEDAIKSGTASARASGDIPIGALRRAILKRSKTLNRARTAPLQPVVTVGEFVAPRIPDSGTARRIANNPGLLGGLATTIEGATAAGTSLIAPQLMRSALPRLMRTSNVPRPASALAGLLAPRIAAGMRPEE